jgi:hypothetical protein
LYRHIRRPDFLLALFARAHGQMRQGERLDLHFYGDIHQCREAFAPYESLIGRALFLHGIVPRDQAMKAIGQASVLASIGNDTAYQLPSKLVEYAMTGKPIVCVSTVENDSSADFLRGYPASLSLVDHGQPPSASQLAAFTGFLRSCAPVEPSFLEDWLAPFRLDSVAQRYAGLAGLDMPPIGPEGSR